VVIDVIRATTTAITAAAGGWRCFPAPSIRAALALARTFEDPLLAGESGGDIPSGFEMDNSPAHLAARADIHRPLILVSSSGTRVIHEARDCDTVYLSCFRNYSVMADYLAGRHSQVAVIGAGSKGEFREEDQACCAWVAARLAGHGYLPVNAETEDAIERWSGRSPESCLCSHSVDFLKRTNRCQDLDFIFTHVADLAAVFAVRDGEVQTVHGHESLELQASDPKSDQEPLPALVA
jgi:2-phosphosulfolactate phosphatase